MAGQVCLRLGEGDLVTCDVQCLQKHSEYFRALFAFGRTDSDAAIDVSGPGVSQAALRWAVQVILSTETAAGSKRHHPLESTEEALEAVKAAAYLQSPVVEDVITLFFQDRLAVHNCFRIARVAGDCACPRLLDLAETEMRKHVDGGGVLWRSWKSLAELSEAEFTQILVQNVTNSTAALFAIVGWVGHDLASRRRHLAAMLDLVTPELVNAKNLLEVDWQEELPEVWDKVAEPVEKYCSKSYSKRLAHWQRVDRSRFRRYWPKMTVTFSPGSDELSYRRHDDGSTGALTRLPAQLDRRSYSAKACVLDDKIYFAGGSEALALWSYDLSAGQWKERSVNVIDTKVGPKKFGGLKLWRSSVQYERVAMVAAAGKVHINVLDNYRSVWACFDTKTKSWTRNRSEWRPDIIVPIFSEQVVHGGKLFFFVNSSSGVKIRVVDANDGSEETKQLRTPLQSKRESYGLAKLGSKLYVVGGAVIDDNERIPQNSAHVFDLEERTWHDLPDLPEGGLDNCVAWHDERGLVVTGNRLDENYRYVHPVWKLSGGMWAGVTEEEERKTSTTTRGRGPRQGRLQKAMVVEVPPRILCYK